MPAIRTQAPFTFYQKIPVSRTPSTRLEKLRHGIIPARFRGTKTVYLLHFDTPIGTDAHQAQHYVGITEDLPTRIRQHRRGTRGQCVLTYELKQRNGTFCLGMSWEHVNEAFEKYLKSWGAHKLFCAECQGIPFF